MYEDSTLRQALEKLRTHNYTAIPVIARSGEYIGTISDGDCLWFLVDNNVGDMHAAENYPVKKLLVKERHHPVNIASTMQDLLAGVMDKNFVPVVDGRNMFMGIITRKDVLKHFTGTEVRTAGEAAPNEEIGS